MANQTIKSTEIISGHIERITETIKNAHEEIGRIKEIVNSVVEFTSTIATSIEEQTRITSYNVCYTKLLRINYMNKTTRLG